MSPLIRSPRGPRLPREPRESRRARQGRAGGHGSAGVYALVVVAVVIAGAIASFVLGRSYRDLALQKAPFGRQAYTPAFDPINDVTLGLPMDSGNKRAATPTTAIRCILVNPTQVILLAGGVVHRAINVARPVTTLSGLVRTVGDPTWLSQSGSKVVVDAAVITQARNPLTVAAPTTTEVTLTVRQGVFLAANQASLRIAGVYVHASDNNTPGAGSRQAVRADLGRPFILANDHSTMDVRDSTFRYLGRDWNSSYGMAWSKGSVGSVSRSTFEHNFIGVYTDHSPSLKVLDNHFFDNSLYGVDPHSYSTNLVVTGNVASRNGRHGIIFSDHVTHGVVRDNVTSGNGLNGIMMDQASTGNSVVGNVVENNRSDGIVIADSADNDITGNTVRGNRVGIHVRGATSTSIVSARNIVTDNDMASQGLTLRADVSTGNGGQFTARRLITIWSSALVVLTALCLLTASSRRGRKRRPSMRTTVSLGVR